MCTLLEQSLLIDVDFTNHQLNCISTYKLKLTHPSPTYTLHLSALQIEITKINIDSTCQKVKLKSSSFPDPKKQSEFLSKLIDDTLNFETYMSVLNFLENGKFKSLNENERIMITMDTDENFNETEIFISIEYILKQPVAGVRFLHFQRNEKLEKYLYSQCHSPCAKYWIPILNDFSEKEVFFGKFKIIVPLGYYAITSGRLEEKIEIEEVEKMAFIYNISRNIKIEHVGLCVGDFHWVSKDNLFHIFASPQLPKTSLAPVVKTFEELLPFVENYEKSEFFSNSQYKLILLPSFNFDVMEPNSFDHFCLIDENVRFLEFEDTIRRRKRIFETINKSVLYSLSVESLNEDGWIISGLNGFLADQFAGGSEIQQKLLLAKTFEKFQSFVETGKDIWPVSSENKIPNALWEHDHVIKMKSRLLIHMISTLANCKKQLAKSVLGKNLINTEGFLKTIKINFGVKKLKYFANQFIRSSGMPEINITYNYSRKEKKIYFSFVQTPIQEKYYQSQLNFRAELEMDKLGKRNADLTVILNEKKTAAPLYSNTLRYFYGRLNIISCETNEIDYKEEVHQIFMDKKKESKMMVNCRAQFRKTLGKKIGDDDDDMCNSILDHRNSSVYDSKKKFSLFSFNNSNRNPVLWIKVDPEIEFLSKINILYVDNEPVILMQLFKEKDAGVFYQMLRLLLINNRTISTVNTLCSLMEKEYELPLRLEIIKTLLKLSETSTGWRGFEILQERLKKTVLESDGSLKANFLTRIEDLNLLKKTIKGLSKLKNEKVEELSCVSSTTIDLILKLLRESDNNNEILDNLLKTALVSSLLESNHPKYILIILNELNIAVNSEIAFPGCKIFILEKILKKFVSFLSKNKLTLQLLDQEEDKNESLRKKIYEKILKIINRIHFFKSKFDCNLFGKYFMFKIEMKLKFEEKSCLETFLFCMKKLEKQRARTNNLVIYERILYEFSEFINRERESFVFTLLKSIKLEDQSLISTLLWEQLTSGFALINPFSQLLWIRIFRDFYFHFAPLHKPITDSIDFPLNPNWMEEDKKKIEGTKEKRILSLKHLSINKRKRTNLEVAKINPKDALISNLRKAATSEGITWKTLAKTILTIIMSEKMIENIERKFMNEEIDSIHNETNEFNFRIKIKSPLTFKLIKKKLFRNQYYSLESVESEIYEVINSYKKNEYIPIEAFSEYELLVESLFIETRKILGDIAENRFNLDQYSVSKLKDSKIKLVLDGDELKFNIGD